MPFIDFTDFFVYYFPFFILDFSIASSFCELEEVIGIFPELFLGLSIFFLFLHCLLISSSGEKNYPLMQSAIVNIASYMLFLTLVLACNFSFSLKSSLFNNTIILDMLSVYSKQYLLVVSIVLIFLVKPYLKHQQINSFEYLLLVLFSIFGLILLCSSNDLITAYLCIEIQSLAFYLLAAYKKNSAFSTEAGLKYFILGSFSSSMFLFGSSIVYGITGTTNFEDLKDLFFYIFDEGLMTINFNILHNVSYTDVLNVGLSFIFISLLFKLALAPFHVWSPDVYESSLTSSTVFFAVLPKLSLFVFFIRFFQFNFTGILESWKFYFIFIALISIFVGSFVGLEIRKIKTLLAYSSVSHMGYVVLAFSAFSCESVQSMISYLLIYMFTNVCVWCIFLILKLKKNNFKKSNMDLSDFSSLNKSNLTLSVFFSIALFSLAGFPPLIGFYVKVKVFAIIVEETQYLAAVFAILCSVISTFYYIRIIKVLFFENNLAGNLYFPLTYFYSFIVAFCFFFLVFLFASPNLFYLSCYRMCF